MPNPVQEGNLIFTDPPRHRQLRKLINSGFTRRRVAVLEPKIREIVRGILDGVATRLGPRVRRRDRRPAAHPDDRRTASAPRPTTGSSSGRGRTRPPAPPTPRSNSTRSWPSAQLFEYFQKLIAARRAEPRDDLLSVLADAEIDEHRLTDEDLLNFAFLLLVAGNETTRNLIALGTLALIDHPDQCRLLVEDPVADPRRGRGDAALEQPGDAHGAHRDGRRRDSRAAHPRGRRRS